MFRKERTNMLDFLANYTKGKIDEEIARLQEYCKDTDVETLVNYLGYRCQNSETFLSDFNTKMGEELSKFIETLNSDATESLRLMNNPFHFQCNWIYVLNHFIGFYIMDDGAFSFRKTGRWGAWEIIDRTSEYADEDTWPEDQRALHHLDDMLKYAEENVRLHESYEACKTPEDKKQWFITHGK